MYIYTVHHHPFDANLVHFTAFLKSARSSSSITSGIAFINAFIRQIFNDSSRVKINQYQSLDGNKDQQGNDELMEECKFEI